MPEYRPRSVAAQERKNRRDQADSLAAVVRAALFQKAPPLFTPSAAFRRDAGSHAAVHRGYNKMILRRARARGHRRGLWLSIFLYPLAVCRRSVKMLKRYGGETKRLTGKGHVRQFAELLSLAYSHSIPPTTYYLFRLFDDEPRRNVSRYIHRFETKTGLFAFLNCNLGDEAAHDLMGNKQAFAQRCIERNLPTPEVYLEVEDGEVVPRCWDQPGLPRNDIIVKRREGKGGHVMMRWEVQPDGRYLGDTGECLDAEGVLDLLRHDSHSMALIAVRRVVNHPDILCMAGSEEKILTTCRLVTGLNEAGVPEVLSSTFKIAVDQSVADNVHFGGLASPVDVHTGSLGPGIETSPLGVPVDVHPVSGAPIAGAKLPMWDDVLALVKRAHEGFPEAIFVGWDVGLTPDGPTLVEGNSAKCVHLQQTPQGAPLGAGRFGEIMAYHLERIDWESAAY